MADIEEILAKAKLPESSVILCMAGDLQSQWEELEGQLNDANTVVWSLGEVSEAKQIAAQMEALRAEMTASREVFKLRALPTKAFSALRGDAPEEGRNDEERATYDERYHQWVCRMVAVTCYDPTMTAEQADALSQTLSSGQWKELADTAWELNAGRRNIPFSSAASALTRPYEQNSKRQEPGESPTADGSAPSRVKKPSTNTTSKAG